MNALPSKHTTPQQRRYNVAATSRPSVVSNDSANSEGLDQTARMRMLIWTFAIRICPKRYFRMAHPICEYYVYDSFFMFCVVVSNRNKRIKMYRLYRKMTIYGHFSIISMHFCLDTKQRKKYFKITRY